MLTWIWNRIKARFSDEHILDIMDWELKPALEQILYHLTQTGDFLLYYHESHHLYVRSRPGNMLQIDTLKGSLNITILDGYYIHGHTYDGIYSKGYNTDTFDQVAVEMVCEFYQVFIDHPSIKQAT